MFVQEAKLAVRLTHPNIVQVLELGQIDNILYIVMELVEGCDLAGLAQAADKAGIRLPPQLVAYVIAEAAEGLASAHQHRDEGGRPVNLIHRDVTPSNILISFDGAVKVTDFGIAKAGNDSLTGFTKTIKGTVAYMSPEQVRGAPLDCRSDIFSLGVVFFELLAGRPLFSGDNRFAVMEGIRNPVVPPLGEAHPGIPGEVERVMRRALAREPEGRYSTASDLGEALSSFLTRSGGYGRRQLSAFMKELFVESIAAQQKRWRREDRVGFTHCVVRLGDPQTTRLFETTILDLDPTVRQDLLRTVANVDLPTRRIPRTLAGAPRHGRLVSRLLWAAVVALLLLLGGLLLIRHTA
jgi:serine/threonine protein kinase